MKTRNKITSISMVLCLLIGYSIESEACTRVVYKGPNNTILTGRTMDFSIEIPANQWIFPRGMKRNGEVGKNSIEWVSKYGSLGVSTWDIAIADGLNEKGLVANLLWLVESNYPTFDKEGETKGMAISLWAQYVLDNFATVAEAVEELSKESFAIVSDFIPGTDKFTTVHLSISDASGDNAILEYIKGKLVIHHDSSYTVMTNDPPYEQQLAIAKYWENIPGKTFLPGSVTAADRFVRASFFINSIPQTDNTRVAVAGVFSVIRNVSVPYGFEIEGYPNLSTTRWRCVADQKELVYYFETALTPNTFWVDLKKIDFSEKAGVRKLDLSDNETYAGEVSAKFKKSKPFQFLGL
ncbi:linear amide C-N hydrolase [Natronoflexus pectinivorans]|uniref:Choloylglycine hydrolase n=1 Tax=Natronoflexus pectinivorans TaxID=682526 RepID=A0A4R2GC04_9BACT|nr:linear amide C-N hydrolase [Natronoflexus pectinivorans]TCO05403.1 choloylglycine hydrolase [Natronoflexus pectinivorans]